MTLRTTDPFITLPSRPTTDMINLRATLCLMRGRPAVREWVITALAGVALCLVLFAHVLPLHVVPRAMDVTHLNTPIKERIALSLLAGELPLWNESVGCGVPFLANPMTQALYPGNLLFLFTDAIRGMKLFILVHFFFTLIAFRVLAHRFDVRGAAAVLGGLLFAGSGAVVSLHWSILWTAGLPWTLLAMAMTRRTLHETPSRAATLWLASSVLMVILAAAFELLLAYAWYAALECVSVWWSQRSRPGGIPLRALSMRVGLLGLCGVIALGAAACQILPTWELVAAGSRAGGVSSGEASMWSLAPAGLLEVLAPGLLGDPQTDSYWGTLLLDTPYELPYLNGIYLGAPAVALAILGMRAVSRRDRLLLATVTVFTLLMAFGSTTFVFELCRTVMPGVSYFRYPIKIFTVTMIPVCLLAAAGAGRLLAGGVSCDRRVAIAGWSVAALLASCLIAHGLFEEHLGAWLAERLEAANLELPVHRLLAGARLALVRGLAVAVLFAAVIHWRHRLSPRLLAGVLLVLVPVEIALANRDLVTTKHVAKFLTPPGVLPRGAELVERAGTTRIGSVIPGRFQFFYPPYLASFHGYRSALDYGAMEVLHSVQFRSAFPDQGERRFSMCSVRYRLTVPSGHVDQDHMRAERLETTLPRASLVPRAAVALEDEGAAWYIRSPQFDPGGEVVLVDAPRELAQRGRTADAPRALGDVAMTRDAAHEVAIEVDARRDAFLLLTDTWYPGWESYLDGRLVPHYRANVAFRALPVPAGRHRVRFIYRPASVAWGFAVSGLTVAGVVVWTIVAARRQRISADRAKADSAAVEMGV